MRPRIKLQEPTVSIESAAETLGISTEVLQQFCENDKNCKYHHKTIFSSSIRFFPVNLKIIKSLLDQRICAAK